MSDTPKQCNCSGPHPTGYCLACGGIRKVDPSPEPAPPDSATPARDSALLDAANLARAPQSNEEWIAKMKHTYKAAYGVSSGGTEYRGRATLHSIEGDLGTVRLKLDLAGAWMEIYGSPSAMEYLGHNLAGRANDARETTSKDSDT